MNENEVLREQVGPVDVNSDYSMRAELVVPDPAPDEAEHFPMVVSVEDALESALVRLLNLEARVAALEAER